jgi:hypothetical protein
MSDPTFTQQFGIAVQTDILRQAAVDRQNWLARQHGHRRDSTWLFRLKRHLAVAFRLGPAPGRDRASLPAHAPDC